MKVNDKGLKFMSEIQFVSSPAITPEEAGRPRFPSAAKKARPTGTKSVSISKNAKPRMARTVSGVAKPTKMRSVKASKK